MNDLQGKVDPHSLQAGSALVEEEEEVTVKEEGILGIIDEDSRIEQFSHLDLPLSQEDFVRRRERSLQARQNTMHIDVNDMDFDRESSRLRRIFSGIPSHNAAAAGPAESAFESRNISNVLDNARVEHPWMLLGGDPQNYQKIISESSQYFGNAASVKSKSGGEPIPAMIAADAPPRGSGQRSFSEEQIRDPAANIIPNEPPPSLSNFGAQYFPQLGQPNLSAQQLAFFQQQLLQQIEQQQHQLGQQLNQEDQIGDQAEQAIVQKQVLQKQPRRELPELNLRPGEVSEEADQDKEFDSKQLGVALPSPDQQREERRLRVKDSLEKKKGKRRKSIVKGKKIKSVFKDQAAVDIEDENEDRMNSQRSAQEREGLLPGGVPPAGEEEKQYVNKSSFEVSSKEVVRPSKETFCGNFLVAVSFPVLVLFFAGVVVGCIVFQEELSSELTTVMPPAFFSGLSLSGSELRLREQAESVRELVWLRDGTSEPYQLIETSIITRTIEGQKGVQDKETLEDLLASITTASGRPFSSIKQGSTTGSFLLEMTWTINDLQPSSPEDFHEAVLAFKRKVVHSGIQAVSEQLEEASWALHSFRNPRTRTHEHPLWQWSAIAGVYLLFQLWNMRTVLVPVFNTLLLALILLVVKVIAHRFIGETGIALGTLAFAKFLTLISMFQVSSVADAWRVAVWSTNPRQGRILNQKAAVILSTSVWTQFFSSCSLCISIAALTAIFQTFELGMILVAALLAQSVTFICILLCQIPFLILYDNSVQPANSASRSDPFAVKPELSEPKQERIWVSPEEEPKMNPPVKVEQPSIWRSLNRAQGKWVFTLDFKLGPMITSWQGPLFALFFCINIFLIFNLVSEGADTAVPLQFWTANGSDDSSTSFKERRKLFLVQGLDLETSKSYLKEAGSFITKLQENQALPHYDPWFSTKLSTDVCETVNSVAGIQLVQPYGCWPEAVLNGSQQVEYYERLGFTASRNSKASNEDPQVFYTILEAEASGELDITELAEELRNHLDGDSTQVLVGDQLEIKEDHLPLSVWIISAAVAPVLILLGSANPLLALITALLTASSFAFISSLLFSITKWVALSRGYLRPLATAAGASSYFTSAASLDFHHRSGSSISEIAPSTFLSQTLTLLLVTVAYSVAASLIDNELWFMEEIGLSIGIACVQALLFATPLLSMLKPILRFSDLKNHFKPKATSPASRPPHAVPPSVKSEAISLNQPPSFGIAGQDREMIPANAEHQHLQGQALNQPMHGQDLELGEIDADKTI